MIRNSHPPVFPLNPFPPSYAPPVLGAPSGTERSYRHKQPVGKPMGCCHMPCARCTPRSGAGGRTSHTAPIYAGVAQSVELYRTKGYAIECPWSLVRVQPPAQNSKRSHQRSINKWGNRGNRAYMRHRRPVRGGQRVTGTFPEALKQAGLQFRSKSGEPLPWANGISPARKCGYALADRCKGCVPNSLLTSKNSSEPKSSICGHMYQGGDAVSKTVCGGFNSQLSVP